jgi:hypothetical protein
VCLASGNAGDELLSAWFAGALPSPSAVGELEHGGGRAARPRTSSSELAQAQANESWPRRWVSSGAAAAAGTTAGELGQKQRGPGFAKPVGTGPVRPVPGGTGPTRYTNQSGSHPQTVAIYLKSQ